MGGGWRMGPGMTAAELLTQIETGCAPVILDVRSRAEFDRGHVPGALHVPFWKARAAARSMTTDPAAPIVVYCEHGPRARFAAALLSWAGFAHVRILDGHMAGWRRQGLREERSRRREVSTSTGKRGTGR